MVQMESKAIQMGRLLPGIYYLFLQIEIFCWYDFNTGLKKNVIYHIRVSSVKNGTLKHSSNSDQRPLFQAESDRSVVQNFGVAQGLYRLNLSKPACKITNYANLESMNILVLLLLQPVRSRSSWQFIYLHLVCFPLQHSKYYFHIDIIIIIIMQMGLLQQTISLYKLCHGEW